MPKTKAAAAVDPSDSWPAYRVERKPIDWLQPYPQNARVHSPEQIEQLRVSLKTYGWTIPVLAREDGTIIAGHCRVDAAILEGMTEIPVIVATGWSEEQCRSYALADNQITLNSTWDKDLLSLEVRDLATLGVDIESLGFEPVELQALLAMDEDTAKVPATTDMNPVIQFNIVFDDEQQQQQWFSFVRLLKSKFPEAETLGGRLSQFLTEQADSGTL